MKARRVVVTGMGVVSPLGNCTDHFWSSISKGKSGARLITKFDASNFSTRFACEVKGFDPADWLDAKLIKRTDPYSQYALAATEEAVQLARLGFEQLNNERTGVIWGSTNGGISTLENQLNSFFLENSESAFNPFFIPKTLPDTAAGLISIKYGLRGVNYCPVAACASASTAIIEAFNHIRWNKADLIITGGSEAAITPGKLGGLGAVKALSTENENPEKASRPFDRTRNGFVLGEGAGALIVESLEHALTRGANIIAEIAGTGLSADAFHMTATHPEGEGAFLSMKLALEEAGIPADAIDYLNAHATSTRLGDITEAKAIERVFGQLPQRLSISATKSMTGHLLGASGAIESVISLMSLLHDFIPPTINTKELGEGIPDTFHFILGEGRKQALEYTLSNTFGFGGHNASLIFKKY